MTKPQPTPNEEKLKTALRRILDKATPEEGQSWILEFVISEDVYQQWEELCK